MLLVLISYLSAADFLPLVYACLFWWASVLAVFLLLGVCFFFQPRAVPLAFVVKLVWSCWIFIFCLFVKLFISLSNLSEGLVVGSSLYHCDHIMLYSWPAEFLLRIQLITSWEFPWMLFVAFLLLFLIFFFCLKLFVSLISMHLSMFFLGFVLPGALYAFWIWVTDFFPC